MRDWIVNEQHDMAVRGDVAEIQVVVPVAVEPPRSGTEGIELRGRRQGKTKKAKQNAAKEREERNTGLGQDVIPFAGIRHQSGKPWR